MFSGLLVGALFGFILQRSRFCMTGGSRHLFNAQSHIAVCVFDRDFSASGGCLCIGGKRTFVNRH